MPLPLTDSQVSQVYRTALPLEHPEQFLTEVATTLSTCPEIGDGTVYRVCRDTRMAHWTPPILASHEGSKYR
jgi:hypothetical protein